MKKEDGGRPSDAELDAIGEGAFWQAFTAAKAKGGLVMDPAIHAMRCALFDAGFAAGLEAGRKAGK